MIERRHIEQVSRCFEHYAMLGNKESFEAVVAAISAALAAFDASPWRSMDSAPRDGTPILMKFAHGWPAVGSWFSTATDGWWDCSCLPVYPTHWMPLPAAPEVKP